MRPLGSHPDFICVGAQKAGTGWFYDQADSHPRVWMPPIKELRYFSPVFTSVQERATRLLRRRLDQRDTGKSVDERDIEFLQRVTSIKANAADEYGLAAYVSLFEPAGELVTGDISPAYHRLEEDWIQAIARALPRCKFLYFIRDPIERLWSQVNMRVRAGKVDPSMLSDEEELIAEIQRERYISPSFQSETIKRWREVLDRDRFRVFVMDDLRSDPVGYRRDVFAYLGLDADACRIEAGYNKKEGNAKVAMASELRTLISQYLGDEYERLQPYIDESRELRRQSQTS